jgi:DNA mismatch endonuclease (patch repair protein)
MFVSRKRVIFVHGCFWHGHRCARGRRVPKSNREYWVKKIARNRARDKKVQRTLRSMGWKGLEIWECQLRAVELVRKRLRMFLE